MVHRWPPLPRPMRWRSADGCDTGANMTAPNKNAAATARGKRRRLLSDDAVGRQVPAARGVAARAAGDLLLRVAPFDLREFQCHRFGHDVAFVHGRRDGADQHVLDLDFVVLDALAHCIGAHEFELRLGDGAAGGACLQQDRRGQVGQLVQHDVLVLAPFGRMAAAGRRGGRLGLLHAPVDGLALDPVLVPVIGRFALDTIDIQIDVDCHYALLWWLKKGQLLVVFGSSATSRSETVSSSSWKCGRRKDTARYTPGRPGTSVTLT